MIFLLHSVRRVGVVSGLLAFAACAGLTLANDAPAVPQPLTGRTQLSLESTSVELSKPLPIPTTEWLDLDELTLPDVPRVALLAPPATKPSKAKAPPRTAQRSIPGSKPAPSSDPPDRSADQSDLFGAFAVPGEETAPAVPDDDVTPIEDDAEQPAPTEQVGPVLAEPDQPPPHDENASELGDSEGWESSDDEADEPVAAPPLLPPKPLLPLSRNQIALRTKLRKVLAYYYTKPLNTQEHDCWEVMHGMLAYELHSKVRDGGLRAEPITSIGHLCYNRACKRKQMLQLKKDGEIDVRVGVGVQGHQGQFLAMLAQCNVTPDYPMLVDGKELTIRDLIKSEQRSCQAKTELTFKLIGLMHYLPSDARWVDNRGESWDIPRLIREELAQPIRGAACGGTHRLSGLTLAARKRVARGEPLDGDWLKADQFVEKYQNYAVRLQNRDGSLSTEWFKGPGSENDIDRRVKTTGHILEWLLYANSDEQLQSPQTLRSVNYLTNLLYSNSTHKWEVGPLCHSLHALVIYDKRVFQPHDNEPEATTVEATPQAPQPRTTSAPRRNSRQRAVGSRQ